MTCAAPASQAPVEATPGPRSVPSSTEHPVYTHCPWGHVPFSRVPVPGTAARALGLRPAAAAAACRARPRSCPMRRAAAQHAPGLRRALSLLIPPLRLPSATSRAVSAAAAQSCQHGRMAAAGLAAPSLVGADLGRVPHSAGHALHGRPARRPGPDQRALQRRRRPQRTRV